MGPQTSKGYSFHTFVPNLAKLYMRTLIATGDTCYKCIAFIGDPWTYFFPKTGRTL